MAHRDTNITLNLTDDGSPAVQHTDEASTDDHESSVTNPDGSVTEYATPRDPPGTTTSENVPDSPLAGEIAAFEQEMDHPEDWTAAEQRAIGLHRLHPTLSNTEISDRLDISQTVVGKARQKRELATLADKTAVYDAFQDLTTLQQTVLAASVRDPDRTTTALAEIADCAPGSAGSIQRRFKPLLRQLTDVGLPPDAPVLTDGGDAVAGEHTTAPEQSATDDATATETETSEDAFTCETCGATFDSQHARNGHTAVHATDDTDDDREMATETDTKTVTARSTASAADGSRPTIDDVRQFVTGLRERATGDRAQDGHTIENSHAVRQVTCDAILTYIERGTHG